MANRLNLTAPHLPNPKGSTQFTQNRYNSLSMWFYVVWLLTAKCVMLMCWNKLINEWTFGQALCGFALVQLEFKWTCGYCNWAEESNAVLKYPYRKSSPWAFLWTILVPTLEGDPVQWTGHGPTNFRLCSGSPHLPIFLSSPGDGTKPLPESLCSLLYYLEGEEWEQN